MQNGGRFIVIAGISSGCLGILYFLSLVLHIPFFITVVLAVAAIFLFSRWLFTGVVGADAEKTAYPFLAILLLILGIFLLVYGSYPLAVKHGGWDAWAFWNLHAKYLADPLNWRKLFTNKVGDHPDYPLLLPGVSAFFIRLTGGYGYTIIPFIFSFSIMLFIPVLIYLENLEKNIIVAGLVLLFFATNTFYLSNGVAQYADIPLAFFFLCALICVNHVPENKTNVIITAACLGCCMWTKNEGLILAAIFILFHARTLFLGGNALYFISALAVPVIVLMVFKIFYAPNNDMFSAQGRDTFSQVFMTDRYKLIYKYFSMALNEKFYFVKVAFFSYLALCIIERQWPGKQMLMLIDCMAAYMMVYVLSVEYLEWHLVTSIDRLMLQLMPAMMYVIARRFSGFRLPKQQAL